MLWQITTILSILPAALGTSVLITTPVQENVSFPERVGPTSEQFRKDPNYVASLSHSIEWFDGNRGMFYRIINSKKIWFIKQVTSDTWVVLRASVTIETPMIRKRTRLRKGKKAISFSLNRPILRTLTLHEKRKIDHQQRRNITTGHPASRAEANITLNGLNPDTLHVPVNAQYYRVINHLSVISDYVYVENSRKYKPCNAIDTMKAIAYSDYTALNTPLTATVKAAFPNGTILSETVTVMQCVGIEYYIKAGANEYIPFTTGSMMVYDVF